MERVEGGSYIESRGLVEALLSKPLKIIHEQLPENSIWCLLMLCVR